jgi:hypothetical protein
MKTTTICSLEIQNCPALASTGFYEMLMQFGINLVVLLIISRALYYKWNRRPDYMFAQLITGVIVFLICGLLRWVQLELGLVLGLFAIFAIIRYRTLNVPVKEMSYLFMAVGISAINAMLRLSQCLPWIVFANFILVILTLSMEKSYFSGKLFCRTITFNDTELLKPSKHAQLLQKLKVMTELDIVRFEIGKVDYAKGNAQIRIYFAAGGNEGFCYHENASCED